MARGNLQRALTHVFGSEGGYSSIRGDPGNWTGGKVGKGTLKGTKYGIAANSYPKLNIKTLTLAQAEEIYRRDYAAKVRFDDLPSGLDLAVLDFAINSGTARSAIALQRVLGIADDGVIGPLTIAAAKAINVRVAIDELCDARMAFLRRLSTWPQFGKGWTRRVESVRTEALAMASATEPAPVPMPPDVPPVDDPAPKTWASLIARFLSAMFNAVRSK